MKLFFLFLLVAPLAKMCSREAPEIFSKNANKLKYFYPSASKILAKSLILSSNDSMFLNSASLEHTSDNYIYISYKNILDANELVNSMPDNELKKKIDVEKYFFYLLNYFNADPWSFSNDLNSNDSILKKGSAAFGKLLLAHQYINQPNGSLKSDSFMNKEIFQIIEYITNTEYVTKKLGIKPINPLIRNLSHPQVFDFFRYVMRCNYYPFHNKLINSFFVRNNSKNEFDKYLIN